MNVWIFSHYASVPGVGQYTGHYDLSRGLIEKGHSVTIFASSFSHYSFQETKLLPSEWHREEMIDGIRFVWIKTPFYNANDLRRIKNMLAFFFKSIVLGLRLKPRPDIAIGVCVHPLAGLAAWIVAKIRRAKFIYEIRDLWPVVLIETGKIQSNSLFARSLRVLEKFLVHVSDKVIGVWRFFNTYVDDIGEDGKKVVWLPQFADLGRLENVYTPPPKASPFTLMYTGGHVNYMGIDIMLRAAEVLQRKHIDDVRFVFMGGGQEKDNLIQLARDLKLNNVEFRDPVPKSKLYSVMSEAHAFLISLRALPHHKYGVSLNKLCDYMAMSRPIIYATQSSYNPVAEVNAGLIVPPENPEALAEAILLLKAMSETERESMGKRGFQYLLDFHEKDKVTHQFEKMLRDVCAA